MLIRLPAPPLQRKLKLLTPHHGKRSRLTKCEMNVHLARARCRSKQLGILPVDGRWRDDIHLLETKVRTLDRHLAINVVASSPEAVLQQYAVFQMEQLPVL
jgi:hypothetical protein